MASSKQGVLGAPDADWAEVGVVLVVAKPEHIVETANILAAPKTTVANFKLPKRCEVVAELPRNALGKVRNSPPRAQYGHLLATGAS